MVRVGTGGGAWLSSLRSCCRRRPDCQGLLGESGRREERQQPRLLIPGGGSEGRVENSWGRLGEGRRPPEGEQKEQHPGPSDRGPRWAADPNSGLSLSWLPFSALASLSPSFPSHEMGLAVVAAEDELGLGQPQSGSLSRRYLLILGQEPGGLDVIPGLALLIHEMAGRRLSSSETGEKNNCTLTRCWCTVGAM